MRYSIITTMIIISGIAVATEAASASGAESSYRSTTTLTPTDADIALANHKRQAPAEKPEKTIVFESPMKVGSGLAAGALALYGGLEAFKTIAYHGREKRLSLVSAESALLAAQSLLSANKATTVTIQSSSQAAAAAPAATTTAEVAAANGAR